eukprot:m.163303 g.163303  ORF g.163303 m.163303 type:complete len:213 (+) comp38852_c0_seq2:334-972(+)
MTEEVCLSCQRKYRSCTCKCCGLCGTAFQMAVGFVRQRSHCRACGNAICSHCYTAGGTKICNVCRRERRRATLRMRETLSMPSDGDGEGAKQQQLGLTGGKLQPDGLAEVAASIPDSQRGTLLVEAAKQGDHHVIVTLLEAGSDVNSTDAMGNTSLFYAAERAHVACLVLLLERGADIRARNSVSVVLSPCPPPVCHVCPRRAHCPYLGIFR